MAIIKCKMCGGDLNLIEGASTAECEFCGSVQTIPNLDDEKKLIQFERAERLRKQCEFDKAAGIYETIVADFRQEAEAYWGLVLCKYGIEYVDDPATGKKIPTCHRSSFDSIMEDSDFEQALENADGTARKVYRDEAKAIEEIRKGIIEVSNNEKPYDIFICYKETDENGDRTLDSVLAQDVYDALTGKGYRVFFSRITLEDKLGMEYEPYIFAALNSAKIMLAFGTDYEYFNAVWVKNEWSRFLKLMAKNKDKHLIPCFKGIDAYDMPKEFARLQAQDLGKVGAIQDLLRGVEKILPRSVGTASATPMTIVSEMDLDALLKRGWMALEDGKWDEAVKAFDQVMNRNPESIRARLGTYLAGKRIRDMVEAEQKYESLFYTTRENGDVKRIRKLADDELSTWFQKLDVQQEMLKQERLERERLERERLERERLEQERLERERLKQEQQKREKRISELERIRKNQKKVRGLISAGNFHTVGLKADGTVVAVGSNSSGACDVATWTDIVAISAREAHTVGLKSDGTAVAVGSNSSGQCTVFGWKDIVTISAGDLHTVGLKANGTVVAVGSNSSGACDVATWTDIVAISARGFHIVGLKANGTVVAVGSNSSGECDVATWTDIVAISAGDAHTVGLKADGTVVAVGSNSSGACDVATWTDIVAISAGDAHTVGLKADGTVVATKYTGIQQVNHGRCEVSGWRDIVAISAGNFHTVGLKADGTVVATKYTGDQLLNCGQCEVFGWKLFRNFNGIEEERAAALKKREEERALAQLRRQRRSAGLCQLCGGELKGFFTKKCVSCGKPKDY